MSSIGATDRKPWDQLPGEPAAAYSRFLTYRNLGPGRSLDAAYTTQRGTAEGTNGNKRRAPGQWRTDSGRWRWPERARAWDVAQLQAVGQQAAVLYVATVEALGRQLLQVLARGDTTPATWAEVLETARALSLLIPPETVGALCEHAKVTGGAGA